MSLIKNHRNNDMTYYSQVNNYHIIKEFFTNNFYSYRISPFNRFQPKVKAISLIPSAVTLPTTACCSWLVVDITLMKVPFHKYYIPQSSTRESSRVHYYTLNITSQKCKNISSSSSVHWGFTGYSKSNLRNLSTNGTTRLSTMLAQQPIL